jgi:hypothetical protein
MAAVIQLSSASSNMEGYLNGWTSGYSSTYGAFWDEGNGLVTNPVNTTVYEQWGNGATGGNGIYMEGEFQYSRGNLTGTVDSITLGSGFSQSASTGFSVSADLVITPDSTFPSAAQDVFDWAIYDLTVNSSLDSFYDYLAAVGTEIHDTAASDTLVGFGGADTFVFTAGNDIVKAGPTGTSGFQDGVDVLDISAWGVSDLSGLLISDLGGNAVIESFLGDTITLNGVSSSVLDASDFLFA